MGGDTSSEWWDVAFSLCASNVLFKAAFNHSLCYDLNMMSYLHNSDMWNSLFGFLVQLGKGYPLPALGKMELENTKLQILQVRDKWFKGGQRYERKCSDLPKECTSWRSIFNCRVVGFSRIMCWLGQMSSSQAEKRCGHEEKDPS